MYPKEERTRFVRWDTLDCAYGFARYDTVDGELGLYDKRRAVESFDRPTALRCTLYRVLLLFLYFISHITVNARSYL